MFAGLSKVDVYPKALADFKVRTTAGGVISLVSGVVIFVLFVTEFASFLSPRTEMTLTVDNQLSRRMQIDFDVEFPFVGCSMISVDAMDETGEMQIGLHHDVTKRRIDEDCTFLAVDGGSQCEIDKSEPTGEHVIKHKVNEPPINATAVAEVAKPGYCGSCYGAAEPGKCCNTCEEVREAYRRKSWTFKGDVEQCEKENALLKLERERHEGCRIFGHLNVQRVAGNFHFAPGKSFRSGQFLVHDISSLGDVSKYNMTHRVHHLAFGTRYEEILEQPLDNTTRFPDKQGMFQYYVKIVPTEHRTRGKAERSHDYSFTEHFRGASARGRTFPGVFFIYDISPILVIYNNAGRSFLHFITQLCAVVGGVFTVAGMADHVIYKGQRILDKRALGKMG